MVDQPKRLNAADAVKAAKAARASGTVENADLSEFDNDGFLIINDKDKLLGKGFVVLQADFLPGQYGESVTLTGVTDAGTAFRMRDSSTGIYKQMAAYKGGYPFAVPGLRVSEYEGPNGRAAKTYYLDSKVN